MTTNLHTLYTSSRMRMAGRYGMQIAKLAAIAVSKAGRGRLFHWQAVKFAERLILNGMTFLVSGDQMEGSLAMSAIRDLETYNAAELAHLAGTFATLLAACAKSDRQQAARSAGAAMQAGIVRDALAGAWLVDHAPKAGKVLAFRKAA